MIKHIGPLLVIGVALTILPGHTWAQSLSLQEATNLIIETTERICYDIKTDGSSEKKELEANINAQLSGLASKLASGGISASGKIANESYKGFLRDQLGVLVSDSIKCRREIYNSLSEKVFPLVEKGESNILYKDVKTAEIQVSQVDDFMTVSINNKVAEQAKFGTASPWRSVTSLLQQGPNAIMIDVSNGIYGGCQGTFRMRINGKIIGELSKNYSIPMDKAPVNASCARDVLTLNLD